MDNAHFDELMGQLSLTADTRLLELVKRNSHVFGLLMTKILETAVEHGTHPATLYARVGNALDNVPRMGSTRMPQEVADALKGKAFTISWGPDIERPAGYYVSIPKYNGGEVVRLEDAENFLRDNLVLPREGRIMPGDGRLRGGKAY